MYMYVYLIAKDDMYNVMQPCQKGVVYPKIFRYLFLHHHRGYANILYHNNPPNEIFLKNIFSKQGDKI